MITEPTYENRAEQPYMAIHHRIHMNEMGSVAPQAHQDMFKWLASHGIEPAGAPFIRYNIINMPGLLDLDFGVPVAKTVAGDERVQAGTLPAGRYAYVVYTGDYDGLMEANRVLVDWAKENNITWDNWENAEGDNFRSRLEIYNSDPALEPDPQKWETVVTIKLPD